MSVFQGDAHSNWLSFMAERFRRDLQFSNIFKVDFVASAGYTIATIYLLRQHDTSFHAAPLLMPLAFAYAALHVLKIMLVIYLERQGGDAREFVGSEQLVTTGFYAYSRNPVYVMSIAQSVVWSLFLVCLGAGQRDAFIAYALAPLLLYAHYWGIDRLIIPNEEAALAKKHPDAFAAYCARVRRWLGRRA